MPCQITHLMTDWSCSMRKLTSREHRAIAIGLIGTVLVLLLALGSQVQAANRLFQTIPTPTPRTIPAPTVDGTSPQAGEGSAAGSSLVVAQEITPQDVMPGQMMNIRLVVTNTMAESVTGILLLDHLDPGLRPLEIRASQGAARVQGQVVLVDVGTMEAGQVVLVLIAARVDPGARNGQIILNQATVDFDGGQASSEIEAAGLPPAELPATGRNRRAP